MATAMAPGCRGYTSDLHARIVVSGFQKLWQGQIMCDTKLIAQGDVYHVHRSFLASCSDYFYLMFTEDFQESRQSEVELKGVTSRGLKALLEYAYTGHMVISSDNLQDVMEAAAHLQFNEVLRFCAKYLKDELTIDNCLHFLKMAELYDLMDCKQETKTFILQNFVPVAQNEDFKDLSLDMLCDFLADDHLHAQTELEVFQVAVKWITKHPDRQTVAKSVLELIRYGLIRPDQMDIVYSTTRQLNDMCGDILQTAFSYHMNLFKQPVMDTMIADMRAYQESLLVVGGGYEENVLCDNLICAKLTDSGVNSSFRELGAVRDRRYFAAAAVVNSFLYIVGGQTAMAGDGSHATNTVFRYNPRDDKWLQLTSMKTPRTHFALAALKDCLIAVGGKNNRLTISSVERYDFAANEWTTASNLAHSLFSHAGCSHEGKVYVSGGCPGEDFTDEFRSYDPKIDGWIMRCPMNQSRGYHVMVSYINNIFVCAGNTNADNRRDVLTTECYNTEIDQWTIVAPMPQGQSEAPVVRYGSKIFILGGYSWDINNFQDIIQTYDMEKDDWSVEERRLHDRMTGVVACNIKLPLRMISQSPPSNWMGGSGHGPGGDREV